jgi:hypothetical protein
MPTKGPLLSAIVPILGFLIISVGITFWGEDIHYLQAFYWRKEMKLQKEIILTHERSKDPIVMAAFNTILVDVMKENNTALPDCILDRDKSESECPHSC